MRIPKYIISAVFLLTVSYTVFGQVPVITDIAPVRTFPKNKLVITGSGFSATSSNLEVWFDNVEGVITSSSDFSIEVTIPVNAKSGNIEVINKLSKLSVKSVIKFSPSFNGESLSAATAATKFATTQVVSGTSTSELFDVCTCDFDGDGKADLAGTKTGVAVDMAILRNTTAAIGTISFAAPFSLNFGVQTFNSACGDLDGDGKPDLVATRAINNRNEIYIRKNTSVPGTLSFINGPVLSMDIGHVSFRPVIRDLNGDGKPEIIVSNAFDSPGNSVYVFVNETSAAIAFAPGLKFNLPDASSTYGIDVQDLDGDKKPEIIANQFNKPDFFILKNTSTTTVTFAAAQKISLGGTLATLNHLTTADFNNDGKLDVAITNSTVNNKVHVMINTSSTGTISFSELGPFDTSDGAFGIDAADVDGDQDIDLVVGNIDFTPSPANTDVTLLINNGNFGALSFETANINTGKKSRNVKLADLDGDSKPEIVYTTVAGNTIDVLRNKICFVPRITNDVPLSVCNGQTIILNAISNNGATYQWSESATPIGGAITNTQSITAGGNYSVAAVSESGTCNTSASIVVGTDAQSVTQNPVITGATAGVITACIGQPIQLGTSSTEPTYSWTGPAGFTSASQNPVVSNAVTATMAGVYELVLKNGVCQSNKATVRVDVVNMQSFVVASNPASGVVCQGSSLTLSTALVAGHTYQWILDGSGDIAGQTATSLNVTSQGSYRVRVTRTAEGCSTETANFPVTIITLPVPSFTSSATGCVGQNITFTNTTQSDNRATVNHSWNFGDASPPSTQVSPTHAYNSAQSFTVTLTSNYTNVGGCSAPFSKQITIVTPSAPTITPSATGICPGETVTLSIPSTYASIQWSNGQSGPTASVSSAGTFTVTANDPNGCATTASIDVSEEVVPVISITTDPDPPSIAVGQSVKFSATGADTFAWTPVETLSNPAVANPVATPTVTTTYTVTGVLTGGCSAEESVTVEVLGELRVTNVFSPNGDGVNDKWVIPGIETYSECTLSLFDGQGRRIMEQKGYQNTWDGSFEGKIVPKGTYFFTIGGCPDKSPITGHVLVAY